MPERTNLRWPMAVALAALVAVSAPAGDFAGEILSNNDIVGLAKAGLSDEIIVAKILSTPNIFDLSTRDIVSLKESGVSDTVIRAMQMAREGSPGQPMLDETRFRMELENVASGMPEARAGGLAWMLANREQSLVPLRQSLTSSRSEIRAAAVAVLARLGDRDSLPAIRNFLADPSPLVRQNTAQALVRMDDVSALAAAEQAVTRQHLNPLDGYVRMLGYARITRAAAALGNILDANPEAQNRVAAAWALGEIGRAATAGRPSLEKALSADADPEVRREAAQAIAKFHDSRSATLLQEACAKDWEVRKVTLAAMAEYPETVEFLVSVMNLGPEQIAADELETARSSLARLTGQDFGMDGSRWSSWYDSNRALFPSGPNVLTSAPEPQAAAVAVASPRRSSEVDVEAWSIVADSAGIPMAPSVDDSRPSGPLPLPGLSGASASPAAPGRASEAATQTFSSAVPHSAGSPGVPTEIPGIGELDASVMGVSDSTTFRTWSSDPERAPRPAARDSAPAQAGGFGSSLLDGSAGMAAGPEQGPMPPPSDSGSGFSASTSFLPSSSIVTPMPAATDDSADMSSLGGLSLPLPPMEDGGYSNPAPAMAAPVADTMVFESASAMPPLPSSSSGAAEMPSPDWLDSIPEPTDIPDSPILFAAPEAAPEPASPFGYEDPWAGTGSEQQTYESVQPASGSSSLRPPPAFESASSAQPAQEIPQSSSVDDMMSANAMDGMPVMSNDILSSPEDMYSSIFVEPEPGQVVVGDPLLPAEAPDPYAQPAGDQYYAAPDAGWGEGGGYTSVDPAGAIPPLPGETAVYDAPPVDDAPSIYDAPADSAGDFLSDPYALETPSQDTPTDDPYSQPAEPVFDPASIEPPVDAVVVTAPDDAAIDAPPPVETTGEALQTERVFTEPSAPMPPVKQEGTVMPTRAGEMPPMLGEGLLGRTK